jgi:hypothetical protein
MEIWIKGRKRRERREERRKKREERREKEKRKVSVLTNHTYQRAQKRNNRDRERHVQKTMRENGVDTHTQAREKIEKKG